jgi:hypothetical protein
LLLVFCKENKPTAIKPHEAVNFAGSEETEFVEVDDLRITAGSIFENMHREWEFEDAPEVKISEFLKDYGEMNSFYSAAFEPARQSRFDIMQSVQTFSFNPIGNGKVRYYLQTTDMDAGNGEVTNMRCLEYRKEFVDCLLILKPNISECTEDIAGITKVILRIKDKYLIWSSVLGLSYAPGKGKSFNSKGNLSNFKKAFKIAMADNPEVLEKRSYILDFPEEDREFFLK